MTTYYFNDDTFKNNELYKTYTANNPAKGYLKIRAYGASEAVPISNLKVEVYKMVGNSNIIFYEGLTNSSGVIDKIELPVPLLNKDDEISPNYTTYNIKASYQDKEINTYKVNMYENIYVVQTINIVPTLNMMAGGN